MARHFTIGGVRLYRRSLIKVMPEERQNLRTHGRAILRRPVEWPLPNRVPVFARAYIDPGGTDIWGPGPYLKVPNRAADEPDEVVNRVFCPWGYPPDRLRVARTSRYLRLLVVQLVRDEDRWLWLLTVEPWEIGTFGFEMGSA